MINRALTYRTCQNAGVIAATAAIAFRDYPDEI
jgi:hypothetical protein